MDNNLDHNEWMDEAPHLSRLPKVNPFAVPDQYFEGLTDRISAAVFVEDLKSEAGIFEAEVPEGYFEHLSEEINSRISLDALQLTKEDGFTLPDGYFDGLQNNMLTKIAEESKPVKVVKLWPAKFTKYAAAASIILVSVFAVYFGQDQLFSPSENIAKTAPLTEDSTLWDIDEETIIEQMETEDTEQITNTSATSAELENYIISHYSQNEIAANL